MNERTHTKHLHTQNWKPKTHIHKSTPLHQQQFNQTMCFRNDQLVVNRRRLSFVCKDILYFFIYICACAAVVFGSDLLLEQLNCKISAKSWEAFWVSANYFDSELCSMLRKIPIHMMNMSIYYKGELNWAIVVLLLNSIYANRRIFYDPKRVESTDLENEIYPICNSINATVYACRIEGKEGVYLNYYQTYL